MLKEMAMDKREIPVSNHKILAKIEEYALLKFIFMEIHFFIFDFFFFSAIYPFASVLSYNHVIDSN